MATKYSSSSSMSKVQSIGDMKCFVTDPKSRLGETGPEVEKYDLLDITKFLNVTSTAKRANGKHDNGEIAAACVREIGKRIGATGWEVVANKEFPGLNYMHSLFWSTKQRPDVTVKCGTAVGFTAEVCSSPMSQTEINAIFGAVDLLRLIRHQRSANINSIVSFAFPKCERKHCLIEIRVTFENFKFTVKNVLYPDLSKGVERLHDAIREQCYHLFQLGLNSCVSKFLIRLSQEECNALCVGGTQLQSRHIMVATSEYVYKVLYSTADSDAHSEVAFQLSEKGLVNRQEFIIYPELVRIPGIKVHTYRYKNVKYSPLDKAEASCCLKELVKRIATALDKLHDIGISHNDVRLPNICFNESYQPILIDVDRCLHVEDLHPMFTENVSSCMYRISEELVNGKQTDFFQLGWMVIQVIHWKDNFHSRKWEDEPVEIQQNKFIKTLIQHGIYDEGLISCLPSGDKTIEDVLHGRAANSITTKPKKPKLGT